MGGRAPSSKVALLWGAAILLVPSSAWAQPSPSAMAHDELHAALVRVGYLYPSSGAFLDAGALGGDLAMFFAKGRVAIEPRIGFRRSLTHARAWYAQVPLDVGLFVRLYDGELGPFVGGGVGLRYLYVHRTETLRLGQQVYVDSRSELAESVLGVGGYLRAGMCFHAGRRASMFLTVDGDFTSGEVWGETLHWGTVASVGLGFGR